jgi:integrase
VSLTLYRRHRRDCKGGHPEDLRTSAYDERKDGWNSCECPILASGTLSRKFKRQNTRRWDWQAARILAEKWEAAGAWDGLSPSQSPNHTTLHEAIGSFLAESVNRSIRPSTFRKYQALTNQVTAYCENRGYVYISELTVSDVDLLYASWKGIRTKTRKIELLKAFLRFLKERGWIETDITEDFRTPQGSLVVASNAAFTDEELERVYRACDRILPAPRGGRGSRTWDGQDVRDFIDLSIHTGLQINEVSLFDIDKCLDGNEVLLRIDKTGAPITTWIPDWLVQRLEARAAAYGPMIFRRGLTVNDKQLCNIWRNKRLKRVFDMAGPWTELPHHHRCRKTFVKILLERGVTPAVVDELLGDPEQTAPRHHSKLGSSCPARAAITLDDTLENRSKPFSIDVGKR